MYFKICPECGVHLDPGERCDCQKDKEKITGAGRGPVREITEKEDKYGNKNNIHARSS